MLGEMRCQKPGISLRPVWPWACECVGNTFLPSCLIFPLTLYRANLVSTLRKPQWQSCSLQIVKAFQPIVVS